MMRPHTIAKNTDANLVINHWGTAVQSPDLQICENYLFPRPNHLLGTKITLVLGGVTRNLSLLLVLLKLQVAEIVFLLLLKTWVQLKLTVLRGRRHRKSK